MFFEISTLAEFMLADLALESVFAQMHVFLVSGEIRSHAEGQLAAWLIAEEGFQLVVDAAMMLSQGSTLAEALAAYLTKIKRIKIAQNVRFNLPYVFSVHRVFYRVLV